MIEIVYRCVPECITENDIKKEAASLPKSFREKNTAYINEILSKKHRPSAYKSTVALNLLCSLLPKDLHSPILKRTENGRPYFENAPNIDFNISHTDKMVVCALCTDKSAFTSPQIGIDCEMIYKKEPLPMAERFFTENELEQIKKSTDQKRTFTEIWTKKEAYIKYLGTGLSMPLSSFDTSTDLGVRFETLEIEEHIMTICANEYLYPIAIISGENKNLS